MTAALALEAPPPPHTVHRALSLARSYGPLRRAEPHQAPVLRLAAPSDRSVLPRWQRGGDGVHEWAEPAHYVRGRTWHRLTGLSPEDRARARLGRVECFTGRPHVNWQSRDHWLQVIVPAAIAARPDALDTPRGRVRPDTLLHWCSTISLYAHERTGRRCIVRVDRLAELMGVSKSTVQRCQAAAEQLGIYVVMSPGRMLTEEETRTARMQGSRQRGMANEAALVVPDWLPHHARAQRPRRRCDTPTSGRYSKSGNLLIVGSFSSQTHSAGGKEPPPAAQRQPRTRPPSTAKRPSGPAEGPQSASRRVYDPLALAVARELTERIPWLHGVAPGRLETGLRRFVNRPRPWLARDVEAAIDQANARLGRASMTRQLVKNPPALLAKYLRDFDPDADHPRAWMDAEQFAREPLSPAQQRNRVLLEIHREARSSASTPASTRRWLAQMRTTVDQARSSRRET